jgi:integrase
MNHELPSRIHQDVSAMERLPASRMSSGPLIQLEASPDHIGGEHGGAPNPPHQAAQVYVPLSEIKPQPTPKPRGIHGSRRSDAVDPFTTQHMTAGDAKAQPPPA